MTSRRAARLAFDAGQITREFIDLGRTPATRPARAGTESADFQERWGAMSEKQRHAWIENQRKNRPPNRPPPGLPAGGVLYFEDAERRKRFREATVEARGPAFCMGGDIEAHRLLNSEKRRAYLLMLDGADDAGVLRATYLDESEVADVRGRFDLERAKRV